MRPSTDNTLPFQLVTGSSATFVWLTISDGSNNELQYLANLLIASASAYSTVFNTESFKIIENNINNISANVTMHGELLEEVSNFN